MKKAFRKITLFTLFALFGVGFLFISSTQAIDNKVQFTPKNIWVDFDELPFEMDDWAPGDSGQKTIVIENNENFDINVYFKAATTSNSNVLADALIVTIDNRSNYLSYLFNNNIPLTSVNSGEPQEYDITIKFDENAENEYQGKSINFDFIITVEEIGDGEGPILPVIIPGGWGRGYTTTTTIPSPTTTIPGRVAGAETKRSGNVPVPSFGTVTTIPLGEKIIKPIVAGAKTIRNTCPVSLIFSKTNPLLAALTCFGHDMCKSYFNPWWSLLLALIVIGGSALLIRNYHFLVWLTLILSLIALFWIFVLSLGLCFNVWLILFIGLFLIGEVIFLKKRKEGPYRT